MNQHPLDFASLFVAIFALYIAQPVANAMGVYTAIIIAAVLGSGMALVRAPSMTRWKAAIFLASMAGTSSITTVGVAELINWKLELPSINPLVAPVALCISLVGHDWPSVARGAWASLRRVFESRYGAPPAPPRSDYRTPPYVPPQIKRHSESPDEHDE